jgi:RHS repeat-associated protein
VTKLGLYYYKAQMYSPSLGRFLQTDPIGTTDDLNLYAYVENNPVHFTEPTGMLARMSATTPSTPPIHR